jgi:hypothetical protein
VRIGVLLSTCIALVVVAPAGIAAAPSSQGRVNITATTAASDSGQAGAPASLKARLVLDQTTVKAGSTIKGTLIFTNTTSQPILVNTCAMDIWDEVGLQTRQIAVATTLPFTPEVMCSPSIELLPGVNRFPVQISTTFNDYGPCYSPSSTKKTPMCHNLTHTGRSPPLPPGRYTTDYLIRGMPADFQPPDPVTVTLRPSGLLPANDGVVIGTAAPCSGAEVVTGLTDSVTADVYLRKGSKIVGRRVVTDKYGPVTNDQSFMFTEPAGKYLAAGPGGRLPVVIRPGRTTSVTIPNGCF